MDSILTPSPTRTRRGRTGGGQKGGEDGGGGGIKLDFGSPSGQTTAGGTPPGGESGGKGRKKASGRSMVSSLFASLFKRASGPASPSPAGTSSSSSSSSSSPRAPASGGGKGARYGSPGRGGMQTPEEFLGRIETCGAQSHVLMAELIRVLESGGVEWAGAFVELGGMDAILDLLRVDYTHDRSRAHKAGRKGGRGRGRGRTVRHSALAATFKVQQVPQFRAYAVRALLKLLNWSPGMDFVLDSDDFVIRILECVPGDHPSIRTDIYKLLAALTLNSPRGYATVLDAYKELARKSKVEPEKRFVPLVKELRVDPMETLGGSATDTEVQFTLLYAAMWLVNCIISRPDSISLRTRRRDEFLALGLRDAVDSLHVVVLSPLPGMVNMETHNMLRAQLDVFLKGSHEDNNALALSSLQLSDPRDLVAHSMAVLTTPQARAGLVDLLQRFLHLALTNRDSRVLGTVLDSAVSHIKTADPEPQLDALTALLSQHIGGAAPTPARPRRTRAPPPPTPQGVLVMGGGGGGGDGSDGGWLESAA